MEPLATRSPGLLARRFARLPSRLAALPSAVLLLLTFGAVALSHLTLLRLPYYWDEGGYYIPAALDFFHTGTLIPEFTNAHPPLPNVVLGTLWHIVGYHILATRLLVCLFAAIGLLSVFRLAKRLLGPAPALALALLTAVYPIWFAQSTLAQADIFAAAFTLWAFALYLPTSSLTDVFPGPTPARRRFAVSLLFCLSVMSKETAIVQPVALAAFEFVLFLSTRRSRPQRAEHRRWLVPLLFPLLPLVAWYAYHRHKTGFTFGNPEFLRYNATANFTLAHILLAFRYRFLHLFWQRNIWVALVLAIACLLLTRRPAAEANMLPRRVLLAIAVLVLANWIAFSVLGGALLTRYLLPVYPLILLVCVSLWRAHTQWWPTLALFTGAAFLLGLWFNPPTAFAPEDTLVYRDMIVVQQNAIHFVAEHYPDARILTAWPVAADLWRPELGYVQRRLQVVSIDSFSLPQIQKAAKEPGRFDTAIVFTTHYLAPEYRAYLLHHPGSSRGREFAAGRDLSPAEIAAMLGGQVVWYQNHNGEWAAVLRFNRSYEARLRIPRIGPINDRPDAASSAPNCGAKLRCTVPVSRRMPRNR